jgi:hypothetical protein
LIRKLLLFKLGALVGMIVAAAFFKRVIRSRGDEESDELALVAILDGVELESRAKAFRGGSMLAWFGGIDVDLSGAELAPGARLSVHALFGGIDVTTPPSWRVESETTAFMGGVDARGSDDRDAPALVLEGMAVFGGIDVGPKASAPGDDG